MTIEDIVSCCDNGEIIWSKGSTKKPQIKTDISAVAA
jgi:hypothetical protein